MVLEDANANFQIFVYSTTTPLRLLVLIALFAVSCEGRYGSGLAASNLQNMYAKNAQAYSEQDYDKSLPFIPRYRFKVSQYLKRRARRLEDLMAPSFRDLFVTGPKDQDY